MVWTSKDETEQVSVNYLNLHSNEKKVGQVSKIAKPTCEALNKFSLEFCVIQPARAGDDSKNRGSDISGGLKGENRVGLNGPFLLFFQKPNIVLYNLINEACDEVYYGKAAGKYSTN